MSEWGRVAEDGTVFVRTTEGGEREVGSWQAGTPEEGLAHFARRYEVLSTEVALLEQRLRSGAGDPQQVASTATRLKSTIPTAAAVGDLASLERRVDALLDKTAEAVEAGKAKKAEARARAHAAAEDEHAEDEHRERLEEHGRAGDHRAEHRHEQAEDQARLASVAVREAADGVRDQHAAEPSQAGRHADEGIGA